MVDGKNRQLGKTIDGVNHFYDGAGNLVRAGFQTDGVSPAWEWTYDALNMQQRYKHTFPDGTFQEYIYLYGPGDLRLMEFDGATGVRKMTYRNLDGSLLREYEVLGFGLYQPGNPGEVWTHKKDFLHGPLGLVATRTHGGGARFFFADHLGTPRVLTNGLGTLTGKHHYFPYGKEYAPGQDDEQQYKYTGHQRDTHGLSDYMRGRTCAFPLQRFMSVDPGRDGWNLYAYVGGNPVNAVDPSGQYIRLSSGKRSNKVKHLLAQAIRRPSIRKGLQKLAESKDFTVIYSAGSLTPRRTIVDQKRRSSGKRSVTFGSFKNPKVADGKLVGVETQIDPDAISVHPVDPSGVVTVGHEVTHGVGMFEATEAGAAWNEAWQVGVDQDKNGSAEAAGIDALNEEPDISMEEAVEILNEWISRD